MSSQQQLSSDGRAHSETPTTTDTARPTASNGLKRKRGAGTSSRGVANLTPEQLERKRANDREAQRAIRERTKNQIETLNREIEGLKSQQPYLDLQVALRQKEAVKAENDELKRRIFSFITSIQPFLTGDGPPQGLEGSNYPHICRMAAQFFTELATAAERNALALHQSGSGPHIIQESPYSAAALQDVNSPGGAITASSPGSQASLARHPGVGASSHMRTWTPSSEPSVRNIHPDLAYNHYDERMGVDFLLESNRPKLANGLALADVDTPSPYTALPRNVGATCTLDAILLNFRQERQQKLQSGVPPPQISGPAYPNFNALLNANTTMYVRLRYRSYQCVLTTPQSLAPNLQSNDRHPTHIPGPQQAPRASTSPLSLSIAILITNPLHLFQVAVMYIMFIVMRWLVEPTRVNYELLPDWITPRPTQLFTPHPHWLDYLPFPRLRDASVQQNPHVIFDNFFVPFTTTLSLGWPYDPADVLVPRPPTNLASIVPVDGSGVEEQVYSINPAFETHLRKPDNWSLGPAFAEAFPEWKELVKIRDR